MMSRNVSRGGTFVLDVKSVCMDEGGVVERANGRFGGIAFLEMLINS